MKIISTNNSVRIESENYSTTYPINYLGYEKTDNGISILNGNRCLFTAPMSDIEVDGTALDISNADRLLDILFKCNGQSNNGQLANQIQSDWFETGSSKPSYIRNRPYTKAIHSDPIVFPQPLCAGHLVEFFEGETLMSVYEWNGWVWVLKGLEPNLIFVHTKAELGYNTNIESYSKLCAQTGDVYGVVMEKGSKYLDAVISTSKIERISKDYSIGLIWLSTSDYNSDILIPPLNARQLIINTSSSGTDTFYNKLIIKDSNINYINIAGCYKNIVFDNIKYLISNYYPAVSVKAENILIKKSQIENLDVTCIMDKNEEVSNKQILIDISDNEIMNSGNISIYFEDNLDSKTLGSVKIVCRNNQSVKNFHITNFQRNVVSGAGIDEFDIDFDETTLNHVSIMDSYLSEQALDSLVYAMTSKKFKENVNFYYSIDNPTPLTQAHQDALIKSGWSIGE